VKVPFGSKVNVAACAGLSCPAVTATPPKANVPLAGKS
jgi:hypothetical protein